MIIIKLEIISKDSDLSLKSGSDTHQLFNFEEVIVLLSVLSFLV
jgi:hypothetical protein